MSSNKVLLCEENLPVSYVEAVDAQGLPREWSEAVCARNHE